jgi:hypothetical protein
MKNDVCNLDPDFRGKAPKDSEGNYLPYCARCQRKVDVSKSRKAWVNWETWEVSLDREAIVKGHSPSVIGEEFIGPDCWKAIGLPA